MKKLSASSMGTYEKCPKKYYFQYIEKPEIEKVEWPHLEFGTCVHRILELFHEDLMNNVRTPEQWSEVMKKSFIRGVGEAKKELIKELIPELKDVVQDYLNMVRKTGIPKTIANEREFSIDIEGFKVKGFIDRLDEIAPNEYHIVDYKTNKNPKYLNNFQLLLYAIAVKELYPNVEIVHGSYVLLKQKSELLSWKFSDSDLEKTRQKVIKIGKDIITDTSWEKRPTMLCNWCDFRSVCQDAWASD